VPTRMPTRSTDDLDALAAWLRSTEPCPGPVPLAPGVTLHDTALFRRHALALLDAGVKGRVREALAWQLRKVKAASEGAG
jgi:hypothetical protein